MTWIDCLFLLAYPWIYVGIALLLASRGRLTLGMTSLLIALAAAMATGDALENRELFRLMQEVDASQMDAALARLRIFTLLKWYALYAASAVVAFQVSSEANWWRWSSVFFALATLFGLAGLVHQPMIEWSVPLLGVAWLMTYVGSFRP